MTFSIKFKEKTCDAASVCRVTAATWHMRVPSQPTPATRLTGHNFHLKTQTKSKSGAGTNTAVAVGVLSLHHIVWHMMPFVIRNSTYALMLHTHSTSLAFINASNVSHSILSEPPHSQGLAGSVINCHLIHSCVSFSELLGLFVFWPKNTN